MAEYVEAFNVDSPADDDELEQGDDVIRQFKRAVRERLETFFNSLEDNPLVPKAAARLFSGTLTLDLGAVGDAFLASNKTREYDVDVIGAKTGDLAFAEWAVDIEGEVPTPAENPPITAESSPSGFDIMTIKAWCIDDDKVRIRVTNTSSIAIASGGTPATIRATVIQVAQALT